MSQSEPSNREVFVLDLGVGNLGNVQRALTSLGATVQVTDDPELVEQAHCVVMPGVGAFRPAREGLTEELEAALRKTLEAGGWLLGICVGYQLLFDQGEERGLNPGLGLIPGVVRRLSGDVQIPHIGWNQLAATQDHPLLNGLSGDEFVYYVHSYAPSPVPREFQIAVTRHGEWFPAVAGRGRVMGTQFHPEKSGAVGLRILKNYLEMCDGSVSGN